METGEKERPIPSTKQESRSLHQHCGNRTGHAIPYIRRKCTFYEKAAAGKHVEFLTARRFSTTKNARCESFSLCLSLESKPSCRHLDICPSWDTPNPYLKTEKKIKQKKKKRTPHQMQCYKYLPHPMEPSLGILLRPSFRVSIPSNAGSSLFCAYRLFSLCLY